MWLSVGFNLSLGHLPAGLHPAGHFRYVAFPLPVISRALYLIQDQSKHYGLEITQHVSQAIVDLCCMYTGTFVYAYA